MPTLSKYTVPPFSRFTERFRGTCPGPDSGYDQCAICGRLVKESVKHMAVVIDGGSEWGDESSDENDPGYMGGFAIGPDCHRKYKVKT